MNTINLGTKGDSSSVYELISILEIKGCDGKIIYEIHDQSTADQKETDPEFVNRSKEFYKTYINSGLVDQWACNDISYAAKIDNVWYFLHETGANTYLGSGPTSTLRLREYCYQKGFKILYIEGTFTEWIVELVSNSKKGEVEKTIEDSINKEVVQTRKTISESYQEVNEIIYQCGEGISKITKTAKKLIEENYRDLFLAAIRSHYPKFDAVAESTNKDGGRIDLKIIDRMRSDIPEYLYEFKVYGSKANIVQGLDKIINKYPTSQNKFNGMVIINNKKGDLSKLMLRIEKYIKEVSIIQPEIPAYTGYRMVVNHKHNRNQTVNCKLTIHVIDIYQNIQDEKE